LISRFADRSRLRVCYEAGPTGFELHRLLSLDGRVVRGRRSVVDPQGARGQGQDRQAGLPTAGPAAPAGELTAISVPTPAQEAVRDLCRTREDMVADLTAPGTG
jgi:transposase